MCNCVPSLGYHGRSRRTVGEAHRKVPPFLPLGALVAPKREFQNLGTLTTATALAGSSSNFGHIHVVTSSNSTIPTLDACSKPAVSTPPSVAVVAPTCSVIPRPSQYRRYLSSAICLVNVRIRFCLLLLPQSHVNLPSGYESPHQAYQTFHETDRARAGKAKNQCWCVRTQQGSRALLPQQGPGKPCPAARCGCRLESLLLGLPITG